MIFLNCKASLPRYNLQSKMYLLFHCESENTPVGNCQTKCCSRILKKEKMPVLDLEHLDR